MRTLLLIHSPLLGPSSWGPVADEADAAGIQVAVPDLSPAFARNGGWSAAVASVSTGYVMPTGDVIVAGHSGAGYYLPTIGEAIGLDRVSFVFVDATLPPAIGTVTPGATISPLLDLHTTNGWLEPWLDWWPDDMIEQLLPNRSDRDVLGQDQPTLRRAIYDEPVPVPDAWQERPVRYVQTSSAYASEAEQIQSLGRRCSTIDGTHLSIVTDPHEVFERMLDH